MAQSIKESCVAVAINGHMLHWLAKTDGVDGEFIKANRHPSGGNCFVLTTPAGQKLAGAAGGGGANEALAKGLKEWSKLTEKERKDLPAGAAARPPEADRVNPPPGGLILRSHIRNLKRDADGKLAVITAEDTKDRAAYPDWNAIYNEPAHYSVWLTEAEWKSLVPANPKPGDGFAVPDPIQKRWIRYHLVNGTFGLPGRWPLEQIRGGEMKIVVESVSSSEVRMRLVGQALMATDAAPLTLPSPARGEEKVVGRGFDCRLHGFLTYDPAKRAFTRFDLIAIGDYWGGDYEGGRFKRPGRTPLGVSFELVQGDTAADRVAPLVHMDREQEYRRYFAAEKP